MSLDVDNATAAALEAAAANNEAAAKSAETWARMVAVGVPSAKDLWETDRSMATEVTIPEGTTHIGDYAFYACVNLASLVIPEGVKTIGQQAFRNCLSLKSLSLPSTIEDITGYAFRGAPTSCEVTIAMTKGELGKIYNTSWGFEDDTLFHCTDGDLTVS